MAEITNPASKTVEEAAAYPDTLIFFTSESAAETYVHANGGTPITAPLAPAAGKVLAPVSSAASAITSVPDFLSRLTSGALWIRVAEVLAGLILLGVGLNSMMKGRPLSAVTGAAGAVGKAAMF